MKVILHGSVYSFKTVKNGLGRLVLLACHKYGSLTLVCQHAGYTWGHGRRLHITWSWRQRP